MSWNINRHCLDSFFKLSDTNILEAIEIFGLVMKTRARLRIVVKSMLINNENGVIISVAVSKCFALAQCAMCVSSYLGQHGKVVTRSRGHKVCTSRS